MAYFSNSSEGEVLEMQCADCPLGAGWSDPNQQQLFDTEPEYLACPVHFVQLNHNYDQVGNTHLKSAMEILIDKEGVCQVREQLLKRRASE